MQLAARDFLRLAEAANSLCFFDLESTGLKGDYNSVLVVSILAYQNEKAVSFCIERPGIDCKVVREARDYLRTFDCWVSYYGKGFDFPMINTRLLRWGLEPLERKPHIDLYYSLKSNLNTSRRSQAHLLTWLGTPEQKMSVGADKWNEVLSDPVKNMPIMRRRCESDCKGLRDLYKKTSHLIKDIKG